MSHNSTPDQYASRVTTGGERWTVARFGALVVTLVADDTDDEQWPDELTARHVTFDTGDMCCYVLTSLD